MWEDHTLPTTTGELQRYAAHYAVTAINRLQYYAASQRFLILAS